MQYQSATQLDSHVIWAKSTVRECRLADIAARRENSAPRFECDLCVVRLCAVPTLDVFVIPDGVTLAARRAAVICRRGRVHPIVAGRGRHGAGGYFRFANVSVWRIFEMNFHHPGLSDRRTRPSRKRRPAAGGTAMCPAAASQTSAPNFVPVSMMPISGPPCCRPARAELLSGDAAGLESVATAKNGRPYCRPSRIACVSARLRRRRGCWPTGCPPRNQLAAGRRHRRRSGCLNP